jgi:hypothetical protein
MKAHACRLPPAPSSAVIGVLLIRDELMNPRWLLLRFRELPDMT